MPQSLEIHSLSLSELEAGDLESPLEAFVKTYKPATDDQFEYLHRLHLLLFKLRAFNADGGYIRLF